MLIGTAGTFVGLRIGGHARRGRGRMRRNHCRYLTAGMTNEYNISQTCSTCFHSIAHPRIRKLVKGIWKAATNYDTSLCLNYGCPTYQAGTTAGIVTYKSRNALPWHMDSILLYRETSHVRGYGIIMTLWLKPISPDVNDRNSTHPVRPQE
jgi:hypothetical protein